MKCLQDKMAQLQIAIYISEWFKTKYCVNDAKYTCFWLKIQSDKNNWAYFKFSIQTDYFVGILG